MTRSLCLAILIVFAACGGSSPREPTMAGIPIRPMDAPPGVREAAAKKFGPTAAVTYLQLNPNAYAIQGMVEDEVKEIRVTANGERIEGDDDDDDDD